MYAHAVVQVVKFTFGYNLYIVVKLIQFALNNLIACIYINYYIVHIDQGDGHVRVRIKTSYSK